MKKILGVLLVGGVVTVVYVKRQAIADALLQLREDVRKRVLAAALAAEELSE
jgi:ribosomal protein S9